MENHEITPAFDDTANLVRRAADASVPLAERHAVFGILVRRYQDQAVGYALALLGDRDRAADAAQEAFLVASARIATLREPAAFSGWLKRLVHTQCCRILRRRALPLAPLGAAETIASATLSPAEQLLRREQAAAVRAALAGLPDKERLVVVLFYIGERSRAEVAAFLGITPITVKKRLASARTHLRERLKDSMDNMEQEIAASRPSRDDSFAAPLVAFNKMFSALIDEGCRLLPCLEKLAEEEPNLDFRDALREINRIIESGEGAVSHGMRKYPQFFPLRYVNAIREGEVKGALEIVLRRLANGTYEPGCIPPYSPPDASNVPAHS